MTLEELARVVAGHYGWVTREGGWVYGTDGQPITQGWTALARELAERRWIIEGVGVNWRVMPQNAPGLGSTIVWRRAGWSGRWERHTVRHTAQRREARATFA